MREIIRVLGMRLLETMLSGVLNEGLNSRNKQTNIKMAPHAYRLDITSIQFPHRKLKICKVSRNHNLYIRFHCFQLKRILRLHLPPTIPTINNCSTGCLENQRQDKNRHESKDDHEEYCHQERGKRCFCVFNTFSFFPTVLACVIWDFSVK